MKKNFPFLTLLLSIGFQTSLFAQAPVNNTCSTAIALTVGAACVNGTNVGANTTVQFETVYSQDVWYKFTATSAYTKISLTNAGDSLDAVIFVVENGCTNPINNELLVVDNAFDGGLDEIGSLETTVGTEYHIAVQGFLNDDKFQGSFCLAVSETVAPPSNDNLDDATFLVSGAACVQGTTVGATLSQGISMSGLPGDYNNDVFFSFVATKDSATISLTEVGPNLNAAIIPIAILGDSFAFIVFTDDGLTGGLNETSTFATQKDSLYLIIILGYQTTNEDEFCIALTEKNVSSLNDLSAIEVFAVFPNPTTENISIKSGSNASVDAVIVTDISGRNVLQAALADQNNSIATSSLSEGVYLIQLFNKGKLVGRSRFIKQ